jgi:hypothetical protein
MPCEPITIFSRTVAPGELLAAVRTQFPDAAVAGDGPAWREITLAFGAGADAKRLTLVHDPGEYAGPGWPDHVRGMQGHVARFPAGDRQPRVRDLVGSFQFALGTRFDPDDSDPAVDDRFGVILGVARLLDGVVFTPSGMWDWSGRVLVSADGAYDEDAEWPEVSADDPDPPTPARVARRAVALVAVTARAVIEREVKLVRLTNTAAADMHARLRRWAGEVGIDDEFEPAERDALATRPGRLDDRALVETIWRVEGLEVLGWALGRTKLPRYDAVSNVDDVWNALGFLDTPAVRALLGAPRLRPRAELESLWRLMRGYDWRLRQFKHGESKPMNFREFAATGPLGPFDAAAFDFVDDDLAVRGVRLDRAAEDVLADAAGIAHERHLAAGWLCRGPATYSRADVSV